MSEFKISSPAPNVESLQADLPREIPLQSELMSNAECEQVFGLEAEHGIKMTMLAKFDIYNPDGNDTEIAAFNVSDNPENPHIVVGDVTGGELGSKLFTIEQGAKIKVGRNYDYIQEDGKGHIGPNELPGLASMGVSAKHLELELSPNGLIATDLGSTNGTTLEYGETTIHEDTVTQPSAAELWIKEQANEVNSGEGKEIRVKINTTENKDAPSTVATEESDQSETEADSDVEDVENRVRETLKEAENIVAILQDPAESETDLSENELFTLREKLKLAFDHFAEAKSRKGAVEAIFPRLEEARRRFNQSKDILRNDNYTVEVADELIGEVTSDIEQYIRKYDGLSRVDIDDAMYEVEQLRRKLDEAIYGKELNALNEIEYTSAYNSASQLLDELYQSQSQLNPSGETQPDIYDQQLVDEFAIRLSRIGDIGGFIDGLEVDISSDQNMIRQETNDLEKYISDLTVAMNLDDEISITHVKNILEHATRDLTDAMGRLDNESGDHPSRKLHIADFQSHLYEIKQTQAVLEDLRRFRSKLQ